MSWKVIHFGDRARLGLARGLELAARAASVGLGPHGRYAMVERDYGTPILRDGVGILRAIHLDDRGMQMGVELAREAAVLCSDTVGDGTKTMAVMLHTLVREGWRLAAAGLDPSIVVQGIEAARDRALDRLRELAHFPPSLDDLAAVAASAANGDAAIGALAADVLNRAGTDGMISVRLGHGLQTLVREETGCHIEAKPLHPALEIPARHGLRELEDCFVILVDGPVATFDDLVPALESILQENQPLVIVCESLGPTALAGLVENNRSDVIASTGLRSTFSGERRRQQLEDLAAFTGASLFGGLADLPLYRADRTMIGTAARLVVDRHRALFVAGGGRPEQVADRVRRLVVEIEGLGPGYELDQRRQRLAGLAGTTVTVEIGSATELEGKERRDRIDTAVRAAKAAAAQGVVAGGGIALLDAAEAARTLRCGKPDFDAGIEAVARALCAPMERLMSNSGQEVGVWTERLKGRYPVGVDLRTGSETDMRSARLMDPVLVLTTALQLAVSTAATVIRSEATIRNGV